LSCPRNSRSVSRRMAFLRRSSRLSYSFLPRASPISTFTSPLLKYT